MIGLQYLRAETARKANSCKRVSERFKTVLGLLAILALFSCAGNKDFNQKTQSQILPGADMSDVRSESMKLINKLLAEELVPGLSLALVDDQGPIWIEGFGMANTTTGDAVGIETVFRVGSLSKPITALAVLQLHQASLIDIDEPLYAQLNDFSIKRRDNQAGQITPRMLLCHHSGIQGDLRKGMFTDIPFTQVTELLHDAYLVSAPGASYSYSNLGYDLLGHLIERHSGQTFASYVDENLMLPLGMSESGFSLTPEMERSFAAGHLNGKVSHLPALRDLPALGFYSSARDMAKLMSALLQASIPQLPAEELNRMWESQAAPGDLQTTPTVALGWFVEANPVYGRLVRHGGSTIMYGAEMALLPDLGLGVVVIANGGHSNHLTRELAAAILSLAAQARGYGEIDFEPTPSTQVDAQPLLPAGGYATSLGLLMIDPQKPRLCACIIERILDLTRFEDGSFALTQESAASLPESYRILGKLRYRSQRTKGQDLLLAEFDGKEILLGNKIDPPLAGQDWRKYLGQYRIINPDKEFTFDEFSLSEENGVICLHYNAPQLSERRVRLPLKPISASEAVVQGVGRGAGETVEIIEINGKSCLRFSGYIGMPETEQ